MCHFNGPSNANVVPPPPLHHGFEVREPALTRYEGGGCEPSTPPVTCSPHSVWSRGFVFSLRRVKNFNLPLGFIHWSRILVKLKSPHLKLGVIVYVFYELASICVTSTEGGCIVFHKNKSGPLIQ